MGDSTHGGDYDRGHMDISEHKATFSGFMKVTEWGGVLIIGLTALLTVTFAMGLGWFPGLLAFVVIGAVAGFMMRMGAAWWATLIASAVLIGLISVVAAFVGGLMGGAPAAG
jgi:hypothetical protein